MQATFEIQFVGGETITVTSGPVDFVRAEAYTGHSLASGDPTFTAMAYIAYSAAKRAGKAGSDFEAWLSDVASIEDADAEGNEPTAA